MEITQAKSKNIFVAAIVTDEQDGNIQSEKMQRYANVVVDAETRLSPRRRAMYRELNERRLESRDSSTIVHNQACLRYSTAELSGKPHFRVEECR